MSDIEDDLARLAEEQRQRDEEQRERDRDALLEEARRRAQEERDNKDVSEWGEGTV